MRAGFVEVVESHYAETEFTDRRRGGDLRALDDRESIMPTNYWKMTPLRAQQSEGFEMGGRTRWVCEESNRGMKSGVRLCVELLVTGRSGAENSEYSRGAAAERKMGSASKV